MHTHTLHSTQAGRQTQTEPHMTDALTHKFISKGRKVICLQAMKLQLGVA